MEKHITHTKATKSLSRFMQIFDGSFPSGAFVHSFGLEPHIVLEKVTNIIELKQFLQNLIVYQYQGFDFVLVKKVYKYFEQNKLNLIIREDEKFSCMTSFEYTKASHDLGDKRAQSAEVDRFTNRHMGDKFRVQGKMKDDLGIGNKAQEKDLYTVLKRTRGITKAANKLTKEQVEEIEALAEKHGLGE